MIIEREPVFDRICVVHALKNVPTSLGNFRSCPNLTDYLLVKYPKVISSRIYTVTRSIVALVFGQHRRLFLNQERGIYRLAKELCIPDRHVSIHVACVPVALFTVAD